MVNRGEVWWYSDPGAKRRPFLVLTRSEGIGALHRLIAVPATTRVRRIRSEVVLGPDDGMPVECALSLDNLTLIQRHLLTERICRLSEARLAQVCDALRFAIEC